VSSASTSKRGYGWKHQKLRNRWGREVARGDVECARCGETIWPEEAWDSGHYDHDRTRYPGPEHRYCNRATATHAARRRRPFVYAKSVGLRVVTHSLARPWPFRKQTGAPGGGVGSLRELGSPDSRAVRISLPVKSAARNPFADGGLHRTVTESG
jgi:hypothetical protein